MNILLIPGFMTNETLWLDMEPELSLLGNIIYGDISQGKDLQEIARHNIAISPKRFVLIGFSFGGYVARWIASLAPERIEALVLIATSNRPDSHRQKTIKHRTAGMVKKESFGGLSLASIQTSLHPYNKNNNKFIERIRTMNQQLGPDVFIHQLTLERENPTYLPNTQHYPVFIIASANDELRTLAEANALQHEFPGATLCVLEGAGHMLPLEQPKILVKTISAWLQKPR